MLLATLSSDAAYWLIAVWLFVLGGVIGSFLNVVVCRLPAGMSLVAPGSHCPACKHPIRWFDNLPIVSWMILRGRCRDCATAISPRYPAVEATAATLFLVLGIVEVLQGGRNLPPRAVELPDAVISPPPALTEQLGAYPYHLLLLSTLLAAALIEYDGHRPPLRLFAPALVLGGLAPLMWPGLRPVAAFPALGGWAAGLAEGLAGLAVGLILGWLAWRALGNKGHLGVVLCPACVGVFLGWQAANVLTIATLGAALAVAAFGRVLPGLRRIPPTAWLGLGTLAWILAWAPLVARFPVLG